ncbi:MAG: hypothetical protein WD021_01270 [Rhodothermales bacterium]
MPIKVHTFHVPKSGHTDDEYEDAFATSDPDRLPFRAAIADGATESAFSGGWARAWVAEYLKHGDLIESAAAARARWTPPADDRWYVEAKAAQGSHAAVLGVEISAAGTDSRPGHIDSRPGGSWRAESLGDCCLFLIRGGALRLSWPFTRADAFHNRPALLSSHASRDDSAGAAAMEAPVATEGTWHAGDAFMLTTDALAAWMLARREERDAWRSLLACADGPSADGPGEAPGDSAPDDRARGAFERFAAAARRGDDHPLSNDDTTAVIIRL